MVLTSVFGTGKLLRSTQPNLLLFSCYVPVEFCPVIGSLLDRIQRRLSAKCPVIVFTSNFFVPVTIGFGGHERALSVDRKPIVSEDSVKPSRWFCFEWDQRKADIPRVASKHFHCSFYWDRITCQAE